MSGKSVQDHYSGEDTGGGMAARILAALRSINGSDAAITPEALAPLDHFNARGVAATQELIALLEPRAGEAILDIGSGIGGLARWISEKHDRAVTGVDITAAFCDAARVLNAACGMTDRVRIFEGSATALPLPDASFDRAYSHGVVMSIADKTSFCREAFRVLDAGGRLVTEPSTSPRTARRRYRRGDGHQEQNERANEQTTMQQNGQDNADEHHLHQTSGDRDRGLAFHVHAKAPAGDHHRRAECDGTARLSHAQSEVTVQVIQ